VDERDRQVFIRERDKCLGAPLVLSHGYCVRER